MAPFILSVFARCDICVKPPQRLAAHGSASIPRPVTWEVGSRDMDPGVYASKPLSWGCGWDPLGVAWGGQGSVGGCSSALILCEDCEFCGLLLLHPVSADF